MYFYDDYKEVKSIYDLNVGDIFLLSIDSTNMPSTLSKQKIRMNSEWTIISKIENRHIVIRNRYGNQIIKLSGLRLKDGVIKIDAYKGITLTFKLFYRRRLSLFKYLKSKLNNFLKWVFLER